MNVDVSVSPSISSEQLWNFYVRNDICEVGFGKEKATRVLQYPQETIAAFNGAELVGIVRASFDGLSANLWEFSLDLRLQGETAHKNGSLMEGDQQKVGWQMAALLKEHLQSLGCTFVTAYGADFEEPFFDAVGFQENVGHKVFYIEGRPYAKA
jgi:hypothetical protein